MRPQKRKAFPSRGSLKVAKKNQTPPSPKIPRTPKIGEHNEGQKTLKTEQAPASFTGGVCADSAGCVCGEGRAGQPAAVLHLDRRRTAGRRAVFPCGPEHHRRELAGRVQLPHPVQASAVCFVAGRAAEAGPALSDRRAAAVDGGGPGHGGGPGPGAENPLAAAGGVRGAGVSALGQRQLYPAGVSGQHLPRPVPAVLCGADRLCPAGGRAAAQKPALVAFGRGGAGGRLALSGGRRVAAALLAGRRAGSGGASFAPHGTEKPERLGTCSGAGPARAGAGGQPAGRGRQKRAGVRRAGGERFLLRQFCPGHRGHGAGEGERDRSAGERAGGGAGVAV